MESLRRILFAQWKVEMISQGQADSLYAETIRDCIKLRWLTFYSYIRYDFSNPHPHGLRLG